MFLKPRLEILPEEQKIVWPQLNEIPKDFVLYGGTAVALRYGHRPSVDFDFFSTNKELNLKSYLSSLQIFTKNTISVTNFSENQLDVLVAIGDKPVKISLIKGDDAIPGSINPPDAILGTPLHIASPLDLMASKIIALHCRTEEKDFVDIAELSQHGISLEKGFAAALAISKLYPAGGSFLNLSALKEDLKLPRVVLNVPKKPEVAPILNEQAKKIELERVFKTRIKASKDFYKHNSLER